MRRAVLPALVLAGGCGKSDDPGTTAPTTAAPTSTLGFFVSSSGHSDGLGPGGSSAGALASWNSAHASQDCSDTAPRGGAGRIYCFAR